MAEKNMERISILKTYKIYINGQFPRTESGRYYSPVNKKGEKLANICLSSRKDFREAVVAARGAFGGWSSRSAFNRSQILYRMAEMLEGRKSQFREELMSMDATAVEADNELNACIDRLVYYAGWCDKYAALFSSVNPVASSHFNFSVPEPMGVVAIVAPQSTALLGLVSLMAPVIAGGNTCIIVASETKPLAAVTFAEALHSSDLPAGVVNILTGKPAELLPWMAEHMDVNALLFAEKDEVGKQLLREKASANLKRVHFYDHLQWQDSKSESPYLILDCQELKTTWHPIENIAGSGSGY